MKILVVCQYYYPEPFRVHEVCELLIKRGHDVTVLTGLPNYPMGKIPEAYRHGKRRVEDVNGVKVIRAPLVPRKESKIGLAVNYFTFVWNACFKALFMKKDFDAALVYQLSPVLMAIPAFVVKWFSRCKRVALYSLDLWPISLRSMGILESSLFFGFMRFVSRRIYNGVDEIGYSSGRFLPYFRNELGLKQKKFCYIPQFADEMFSDIPPIADAKRHFVFAGNVGFMQRVDTIIEAAALTKDTDDIVWHIVGDGSAIEHCLKRATELGVTDNLIFHGRKDISEMPYYYGLADAMLVTLDDERFLTYTLPGKVQSYMAAGKAILASAAGETADVIADAACGYCVPPRDAASLAEAAKSMTKTDARAFGEKAKQYYNSHFTVEKHMDLLEQLIRG